MNQPSPEHSGIEHLTFGQSAVRAFQWGLSRAALLAGALLLIQGCSRILMGRSVPALELCLDAALVMVALFVLLFPARLVWQSRTALDRSFTWIGFIATFFGLAILVVFFGSLILDCIRWFHYTPKFVEAQNAELRPKLKPDWEKQFIEEQLAATRKSMARDLELEMRRQASTIARSVGAHAGLPVPSVLPWLANRVALSEGEKPGFEKIEQIRTDYEILVFPQERKNLTPTAREKKNEAVKGLRPEHGPWDNLSYFFSHGTSHEPQDAGIWNALQGSLWVAVISIIFAVPIGVGAALYLEEYRTAGWLGNIIQVNINNLAGVPSVVYGILGGFVFVDMIFTPLSQMHEGIAQRNVLGGGMTLGLLTLPLVIVSSQEAIRAVPKSIREGALALGATKWQATWRLVLPQARPGILTGTILSVSRAIGEAAPLVLFGALIYVDQNPSLFSRFSVLPMQIFEWSSHPVESLPSGESVDLWRYNAAMASMVLLTMLLGLNGIAIVMRNRAQRTTRV